MVAYEGDPNNPGTQSKGPLQIKLESGEYACPYCPKTMKMWFKMERHIITHTGDRPYACTNCEKTFNRKDHCDRHLRNIHELENEKKEKRKFKTILLHLNNCKY